MPQVFKTKSYLHDAGIAHTRKYRGAPGTSLIAFLIVLSSHFLLEFDLKNVFLIFQMIQAIQVLRFHLLELEKVYRLLAKLYK